jgi:hypothetical protein
MENADMKGPTPSVSFSLEIVSANRKRIKKNTQPFFSFNDSPIPIVFPFRKSLKYEAKG